MELLGCLNDEDVKYLVNTALMLIVFLKYESEAAVLYSCIEYVGFKFVISRCEQAITP